MPTPTQQIFAALLAIGITVSGHCHAQTAAVPCDIRTLGAIGDGTTVETKILQAAIDKANAAGGGTVLLAGGRFVTGTLYLKSHVTLRIDAGAALLGSPLIADYATDTDRTMYHEPYMDRCLIFARDAQDIAIEGKGTIDGQGKSFPNHGDPQKNRPKMFRLLRCSHVQMQDITLQFPASWTTEWRYCDDVAVDGIRIASRGISNGDGLDFDGCTRVRVTHSTFDTGDDCLCLQTSLTDKPCRDVAVSDCDFSGRWAGIRIGLLSRGNFENVTVTNCRFHDHNDSGLKIQMNEGGEMSNMTFSHLTMTNVPRPVFLTFCQKNAWVDAPPDALPPMRSVRHLQFDHITADTNNGSKNAGFVVVGMPGHPVEDLTFSDIRATFHGGGTAEDAAGGAGVAEFTPENLGNRWPEMRNLGRTVPARGLYARHVHGLTLRNVEFDTKVPDARPPIVFDDVTDAKTDGSAAPVTVSPTPPLIMNSLPKNHSPMRIFLALLSLAAAAGPLQGQDDARPVVDASKVVMQAKARPDLPTLYVVGDSTARSDTPLRGWGSELGAFFDPAKINVVNRAIGGRSSRTFMSEGRWDKVLAELKPGDFVLVQFGHNDAGDYKDPRAKGRPSIHGEGDDTAEAVKADLVTTETIHTFGWYLRKYATDAKAKKVTPILLSMVPHKVWKDGKISRSEQDTFVRWTRNAATATGALFIDTNDVIAKGLERLGPEKVEPLFGDPRTHSSPEGAKYNAAAVVVGLKALQPDPLAADFSKLADDLPPSLTSPWLHEKVSRCFGMCDARAIFILCHPERSEAQSKDLAAWNAPAPN